MKSEKVSGDLRGSSETDRVRSSKRRKTQVNQKPWKDTNR